MYFVLELGDGVFSANDLVSPGFPTDAQSLACILQDQLDAINQEIRWEYQPLESALLTRARSWISILLISGDAA